MIMWNTDVNAPSCPGEIVDESGQTRLIQTDLDWPGIASTFGWSTREVQHKCKHAATDGTVDCEDCGMAASDFILAAGDWLRDNHGATAEDPGYFGDN